MILFPIVPNLSFAISLFLNSKNMRNTWETLGTYLLSGKNSLKLKKGRINTNDEI